ncbi:C-C chemokine receptor type 8 [Denticeps clupeoides]|uniref:C-C chemokine receptor type 8 n=1 Tax=Denticeps clupeoides TaxID=299321 RepID=UPI0010A3FF21|nr:C-C chemokine receptor type 8-like [Denticeps clupeoides]
MVTARTRLLCLREAVHSEAVMVRDGTFACESSGDAGDAGTCSWSSCSSSPCSSTCSATSASSGPSCPCPAAGGGGVNDVALQGRRGRRGLRGPPDAHPGLLPLLRQPRLLHAPAEVQDAAVQPPLLRPQSSFLNPHQAAAPGGTCRNDRIFPAVRRRSACAGGFGPSCSVAGSFSLSVSSQECRGVEKISQNPPQDRLQGWRIAMETDQAWNISDYYEPIMLEDNELLGPVNIIAAVLYCVIFIVSLLGNLFLLWALLKQENLRKTSSLLLLHLTASDLLFVLPLPVWVVHHVYGWPFGEAACRLLNGAIFLGLYSYMAFLSAMTVHRYRAVVHAVSASVQTSGGFRVHLCCALLWLVCVMSSVPEVMFSSIMESPEGTLCVSTQQTTLTLVEIYTQISLFFLLPFIVITFCYAKIWATVRRSRIKKRDEAVRLIFCIVIGFFICWAPFNIFLFIHSLNILNLFPLDYTSSVWTHLVTHTLAYFHCCLNPIVHIFGGGKFRRYLRVVGGFRLLSVRERTQTFSSQTCETHPSPAHQTNVSGFKVGEVEI